MTGTRLSARLCLELFLVLCATAGLVGCNMVSGADGIIIEDADDDDDGGSGAGNPTGGQGGTGGVATGGAGAGAGNPTGGQGGTGNAPPTEQLAPVDGVSMTKISVYQAVERPVMENGSPAGATAPVVAGREALVRVFYQTDGGYNGQPVVARFIVDGAAPIETQASLGGNSSDGDLGSTINFDVPPEMMNMGAQFRVELLQSTEMTSGANAGATYPAEGTADLQVEQAGSLKVTLVPIAYNADGSGRLPDTSPAQLQKYEDLFYAMYPITDIQLSVRAAVGTNTTLSSGGGGWSSVLNGVADLRSQDGASFDEYYYGIFEPSSSLSNYCNGGCVLGLGFVGGPQDDYARAAIGIGFTGDASVDTAVHELGHNHGRNHAPCGGASNSDPSYPYNGGQIGAWGFNLLTGQLYSPSQHVDMMSYCDPAWISDYNYEKLFQRVQVTSGSDLFIPEAMKNLTWERVLVGPNGTVEPMTPIQLERPPFGESVAVELDTNSGIEQVTGRFLKYDHIEGGVLFVPPTVSGPKVLHTQINGHLLDAILQ